MARSHLNLEQRMQEQRDALARYVEAQRAEPVKQSGKPRTRAQIRRARAAKAARIATGEAGASTQQFPNAFPAVNGDPIHEGIGRTLSRGL